MGCRVECVCARWHAARSALAAIRLGPPSCTWSPTYARNVHHGALVAHIGVAR